MTTAPERARLIVRLLFALTTAVLVFATAYLCAWNNFRKHGDFSYQRQQTRAELEDLRKEIEAFRAATGKPPAKLAELESVKKKDRRMDQAGRPTDSWGRPLRYEVEDGGYQQYSLGQDGEPGGVGPDADLYAGKEDPPRPQPTLWEFTTNPRTVGMQLACALAGVIAFPIFLLQGKGPPGQRPSLARVFVANAVTAVFAVLAAAVMAFLHLPGVGH